MSRYLTLIVLFFSVLVVANISHLASGQDTLKTKLRELDKTQNGKNTPFDDVEKRGVELLNEFTDPEDQGQINFQLAEIYGKTGMIRTDLVIQHSKSALELPIDSLQRLRLYVLWGNAISLGNIHKPIQEQKPFSEVRRLAVKPYLEGLKEMKKYEIPEQMPNLPMGGFKYDMSENAPNYQKIKKMHDDQMAARTEAQFDRKLWFSHQTLMNGVIDLYSRPPFAATELRQLATKILDDPEKVDALMKRIEAKGALKDDPIPEKANAKNPG
jgi:hypothetical protein